MDFNDWISMLKDKSSKAIIDYPCMYPGSDELYVSINKENDIYLLLEILPNIYVRSLLLSEENDCVKIAKSKGLYELADKLKKDRDMIRNNYAGQYLYVKLFIDDIIPSTLLNCIPKDILNIIIMFTFNTDEVSGIYRKMAQTHIFKSCV
jgi:hypothetical protein